MNQTYQIARISLDQIERAYLLVHPVAYSLDRTAWRAFCSSILSRRYDRRSDYEDIIVAMDLLGYVRGICVMKVAEHPVYGCILDVPIFVVTSVADERGVSAELLRHVRSVGSVKGCDSIRFWTLSDDNWSRHLRKEEFERWDHGLVMQLGPKSSH